MTRRACGFTFFEFAVCMALCAVLAGALLVRVADYQAETERVAVQQLVGSLRTAMAVRAAQRLALEGNAGLFKLAQENPLTWLSRPPENYLGEYYRPEEGLLKPGHWYYDPADKSVNFLQRRDSFSLRTSKLLRFKVELVRTPDPSRSAGRRDVTQGLILVQLADRVSSE